MNFTNRKSQLRTNNWFRTFYFVILKWFKGKTIFAVSKPILIRFKRKSTKLNVNHYITMAKKILTRYSRFNQGTMDHGPRSADDSACQAIWLFLSMQLVAVTGLNPGLLLEGPWIMDHDIFVERPSSFCRSLLVDLNLRTGRTVRTTKLCIFEVVSEVH